MTAPASYLASTLSVQASTSIQQLRRQTHGWQVFSAEHGWLETCFAAVLLAVPAPQAAPLLQQPAPELAALAGSAVMRGCWALMLRFAAPVDLPFDAAFVNQGPLRWIARNSSKPGRSGEETWLLHACAEWSEAHLEEDSDKRRRSAAGRLWPTGRSGPTRLDCAPLALRRHRAGPRRGLRLASRDWPGALLRLAQRWQSGGCLAQRPDAG
jgi:predicted NAD/FAD-dependent oxidoreductase